MLRNKHFSKNKFSLSKKKLNANKIKEDDYEKIINSFLVNKLMAMSALNGIDEEYDIFEEKEKNKLKKISPKKKIKALEYKGNSSTLISNEKYIKNKITISTL